MIVSNYLVNYIKARSASTAPLIAFSLLFFKMSEANQK